MRTSALCISRVVVVMVAGALSAPQVNCVRAQSNAAANIAPKVTAYCAIPGILDESCFHNAFSALAGKAGAKLAVPAGTYRIGTLAIANSNVALECEPGAILQPTEASNGIRVTSNNVVFDGCTLDAGKIKSYPGMVVTGASGFTFENGAIVHVGQQSGLQLSQTTNALIDRNSFATDGAGDVVFAYGPTSNIRITNNHGVGTIDVDSGRNAGKASVGVLFSGNTMQPVVNAPILTVGDFSDGYGPASPITDIVISGNTCNVVAPSPAVAPFACFSVVGDDGLTFDHNTMNAVGQYVQDSLLEIGTTDASIANNIFRAGNDPGAQSYNDIIIYSADVHLSNNTFNGTSAYGDAISLYAESNADDISISGGSITSDNSFGALITSQKAGSGYSGQGHCSIQGGVALAPARCTVNVTKDGGLTFKITYAGRYTAPPTSITTDLTTQGTPASARIGRAQNDAIAVACNQSRLRLRVTGIVGGGATGPVSSAAIVFYPGKNAPVGGGFSRASGIAVTGGSGSGLKLDILGVDPRGGITSLGVSPGHAGNGYKMGDVIYLPVSGSQTAAEAQGIEIDGGLTISGAFLRGIDIQSFNQASCPVSAEVQNVSISGGSDAAPIATGIFQRGATVKSGTVRLAHVTRAVDTDR